MVFVDLFSQIWHYAGPARGRIVLYLVVHALSMVGRLSAPLIFAQILNTVQTGEAQMMQTVISWFALWTALFAIGALLHRWGRYIEFQVSYEVYRAFINRQYKKLTSLPLKWHTDRHSGDTINRIQMAGHALREFVEAQFRHVEFVVMFWGPILALFILSWQAALIALLTAAITLFVINKFDIRLVQLYRELNENRNFVAAGIFDYISNIKTIITLRLGRRTAREIDRRLDNGYQIHVHSEGIVNGIKWTTVSTIIFLMNTIIMLFYIWTQYSVGTAVLVGNLVAMYQYLQGMGGTFFNMTFEYQNILNRHTRFVSAEPIMEADVAKDHDIGYDVPTWSYTAISDLSFEYEPGKKTLTDITFGFASGERLALVGESGSGKSSLMALLRGLYEPKHAVLTLDGQDFSSLSPLFARTTLMPQEPEIFENTIGYNITVGIEYPREDIENAVRLARFDRVLARLPHGLDTDVRERGVTLSGGERQRLALARGILAAKNSTIILMDEPTSSVDSHNEAQIFKSLFDHFKDRTIIASVHRLHMLRNFDSILVMERGRIVQRGTFETLKSEPGPFQQQWENYLESSASQG